MRPTGPAEGAAHGNARRRKEAPTRPRPGFDMPRMRRDRDGYWRCSWTAADGSRRNRSLGRDKARARERFQALLTQWEADALARTGGRGPLTVHDAWQRYRVHAEAYYRHPDGEPTGEALRISYAIRPLLLLAGHRPAAALTPSLLAEVREEMVRAGLALGVVNQRVGAIRRVWRWLAAQELVPAGVWEALSALHRLKPGRTQARARQPVRPADEAAVEAACGQLPRSLATMVRLQLLTGMRPGEVCALRPRELRRDGALWIYTPGRHKTAHHGIARRIRLGPRAQRLLAPYLAGDQDALVFTPRLAMAERRLGPLARVDEPGAGWKVAAYRRAICRACEAAGVERFGPNQLRHAAGTRYRRLSGLDSVQVLLGHRHASTSEIYAEADDRKVEPLLLEHG